MLQIGLGDVAAHAVAQQDDGRAGVLLADVLVEAGQVADHLAPAVLVCVVAQHPLFRRLAVATLVGGVDGIAFGAQGLGQARIAPAVLGHAVGQQDHRLEWRLGQPLVDEEAVVVARGQPERVMGHGDSFARRRCTL